MTSPIYYTEQPKAQFDSSWLSALGGVISGGIDALIPVPGDKVALNFVVNSIIGGSLTVISETVALEVEYIDTSTIKIGDTLYPIDVTIDAAVTTAATIFIAGALTPVGASLASVAAIGIVTSTTVNFAYSRFIDPISESFLDALAGTVDVDVRLKDTNGEVLGGALWKDGIYGLTHLQVAMDLVNEAVSQGLTSDITSGMQVDVLHGSAEAGQIYTLLDDNILLGITNIRKNAMTLSAAHDNTIIDNKERAAA